MAEDRHSLMNRRPDPGMGNMSLSIVKIMAKYGIEIGDSQVRSVCGCCGKESCIGNGFVYKDGDAYAAYCAMWSTNCPIDGVNIALGIGEWGDDQSPSDRTCFGLIVRRIADEYTLRVIDPEESAWKNKKVLGDMLSRNEGISHPLLKETFTIVERIVEEHSAIREHLSGPAHAGAPAPQGRCRFKDLFGGWSEEEDRRFKHRLADLEHVAPDEW